MINMIQLFEWYIEKIYDNNYVAHGYVTGHPKLLDGEHIHTSPIVQVEETGEQRLLLITRSGNRYCLAGEEICYEEIKNTKKNLQVFGVHDFCKDAGRLSVRKKEKKYKELKKHLSENELFLEMVGESCIGAYFKDGGGIHELQISIHTGMFQDSVLCMKGGVADFRYFPKGFLSPEIATYHVSSNIERIHICNRGKDGILFNHKILCESEMTTLVKKQDFGGEGLLSPDAYDGKCLFFEDMDKEE